MIAEKIDIKKITLEQELEQLAVRKRLAEIELEEICLRSELRLLNQNNTQLEETKTLPTAMENDNPLLKRDAGPDPKGEAVPWELKPLGRIEAKVDSLLMSQITDKAPPNKLFEQKYLHGLTTKQHAALQMLLDGKSNQDIADRMNVTINTAKVHIRGVAKQVGVKTRNQIILRLKKEFDACDEEEYLSMSGGLPKDWHENYVSPKDCRYKHLYEKRR